jgi:hypothetical protein
MTWELGTLRFGAGRLGDVFEPFFGAGITGEGLNPPTEAGTREVFNAS